MSKVINIFFLIIFLSFPAMISHAGSVYPDTLNNGNYICVDGGMGVGTYADRSSVMVQNYNPPHYQIAIKVIRVAFSDEYWRTHETYIGSPYKILGSSIEYFRYNWEKKSVSYLAHNGWKDWNIQYDYSHAEGNPFIPLTAEVAFVTAYNMRFYDDTLGYSPVLKKNRRVIEESFYSVLGI